MNKKGFTLIEILVVLVVIGILVAIILPNTLRSIQQGNARAAAATLRNIDAAIQVCYNAQPSTNATPWLSCNTTALLVTGGYMESIPTNDSGGIPYTIIAAAAAPGGIATDQGYVSDKLPHFPTWPDVTNYV